MKDLLDVFKALSDETRLRIIKLLEGGELCVCDIVAALGMVQPKVSFHLGVLKNSGLLKDRKQGKWVHYRLNEGELFTRLLLLSVAEKIQDGDIEKDRARLETFLLSKDEGGNGLSPGDGKTVCCTR